MSVTLTSLTNHIDISKESFDENTGVSKITLATPIGYFSGVARVHPEDLAVGNYNSLTGLRFAYVRALIKYVSRIKVIKMAAFKEMNQGWAVTKKNTDASCYMQARAYILKEEIQDCREIIRYLKDSIATDIQYLAKNN